MRRFSGADLACVRILEKVESAMKLVTAGMSIRNIFSTRFRIKSLVYVEKCSDQNHEGYSRIRDRIVWSGV